MPSILSQAIAGTIVVLTIGITIWSVMYPNEERTKIVTSFFGVLSFLLGAGLQEFRVADERERADSARNEVVAVRARETQLQSELALSIQNLDDMERIIAAAPRQNGRILLDDAARNRARTLRDNQHQRFERLVAPR